MLDEADTANQILCVTAAQVVLRAMAIRSSTRAATVSMPDSASLQGALNQINAILVRWSTKSPLMRKPCIALLFRFSVLMHWLSGNQLSTIQQAQTGR